MNAEELSKIRNIIKNAGNIAVLTGAGISTKSNIPDFRGKEGIANTIRDYGMAYEELISHTTFVNDPELFYHFYWRHMVYKDAKPNLAHKILAENEDKYKMTIITQNIDCLHQAAGSKKVIEVHGSVHSYTCTGCHAHYDLEELDTKTVPICNKCGKIIKPDVTLYEEALPEDALNRALLTVQRATLLIILGTSLRVYPIAGLPYYFRGSHIILINAEETPFDSKCDYVIHEDIGETLQAIFGEK
ncbi:MAG: NAD-dependent protein deacylase [Bacilli bacterium]|nr:NAD-dependent protein deacylase [Bacilli bacterium]